MNETSEKSFRFGRVYVFVMAKIAILALSLSVVGPSYLLLKGYSGRASDMDLAFGVMLFYPVGFLFVLYSGLRARRLWAYWAHQMLLLVAAVSLMGCALVYSPRWLYAVGAVFTSGCYVYFASRSSLFPRRIYRSFGVAMADYCPSQLERYTRPLWLVASLVFLGYNALSVYFARPSLPSVLVLDVIRVVLFVWHIAVLAFGFTRRYTQLLLAELLLCLGGWAALTVPGSLLLVLSRDTVSWDYLVILAINPTIGAFHLVTTYLMYRCNLRFHDHRATFLSSKKLTAY